MKQVTLPVVLLLLLPAHLPAQERASFDVILDIDYRSAERAISLYEGLEGHPSDIAEIPGSQIALATTAYLAQRSLTKADLERSLQAAKFNQDLGSDPFCIRDAKANVGALEELLSATIRRNFAQKVVKTVEQLFPAGARIRTHIPLYFVAFGHENIDAFVQRVLWRGNTPVFVGEGQGELTIVVNLAKAVHYGRTTDERFIGMLGVVAHEVFHATFGVYKDGSSLWRDYYARHRSYFDRLLDLTQNEGIAYYLSLVQGTRGRLTPDWERNVRSAFERFNSAAEEMLSMRTSPARAEDLLRLSNTSGFWTSYGAVTGMIVARQIDQTMGRESLMQTIAEGPSDFFLKYASVMKRDRNVPPLSPGVLDAIAR
jgi:hypothetical protein